MGREMQTDRIQSLNAALHDLVQEYTTFIPACHGCPKFRDMTTENLEL